VHPPGSRRSSRRPAEVDGGAEQRRLEATVARLRLELARLRGEVDDDVQASPGVADVAAEDAGAGEAVAEAETRAAAAEERVRLLVEELGSERCALDELRARLAVLEEAAGRVAEDAGAADAGLERIAALETALAEEREARVRELDREVDELRNWISAAESRRRGLFRRGLLPPPPPGRISPGP
jgi:vacuolar-type H+-ATPase subunit I/STV1